jgi:signal transduction histidine kinase
MRTTPEDPNEQRVLLLAPTRRDGEVTRELLGRADVDCQVCTDAAALAATARIGAGALMFTDTALGDPAIDVLLASLARQPPWSDLPMVLLTRDGVHSPVTARVLGLLTNVTLLDRPTSTRSMVSAVHAALRARMRQYELRDQLAALRRAEDALRVEHRRKDEFLATLAHELRNPLAPIRTGLQLLARSPVDDPGVPQVRSMMDRQLGLLIRLIDDLLDLSRISSGKIVLRRERVDLRAVVEGAIEGSQPQIEAGGHALTVDLSPEPVWVFADASRLSQAVGNLITNAAKYTQRGGRIAIEVAGRADKAVVRVADNGAGIPPEMLGRVFDMFTQVNQTLDRSQGGLGIGLSLVKRVMQMHGGTVLAESPGLQRGSTFTLRLPLHDALASQPPIVDWERDATAPQRTRAGDRSGIGAGSTVRYRG